jgi:uncharacterized protein
VKRSFSGILLVVLLASLASAGCGRLRSAALRKDAGATSGIFELSSATPAAASVAAIASDSPDDSTSLDNETAADAFRKGFLLHRKGCQQDDTYACNSLGVDYEKGRGIPKLLPRAVASFKKACDLGAGFGCANLGRMTEAGTGTAADPVRATALYEQACSGNSSAGCSFLGISYSKGFGVTKDPVKAVLYLKQGCESPTEPDAYGCYMLGDLYAKGQGIAADPKKAAIYYKKACDGDYAAGCTSLGQVLQGAP